MAEREREREKQRERERERVTKELPTAQTSEPISENRVHKQAKT